MMVNNKKKKEEEETGKRGKVTDIKMKKKWKNKIR